MSRYFLYNGMVEYTMELYSLLDFEEITVLFTRIN